MFWLGLTLRRGTDNNLAHVTGTVCPSLCADGGQVVGARQVIDTRAQSLP
jgi:hypothetical protein